MDFIFRMKKKEKNWTIFPEKIVKTFSTNFSFKNKQNSFLKNKM